MDDRRGEEIWCVSVWLLNWPVVISLEVAVVTALYLQTLNVPVCLLPVILEAVVFVQSVKGVIGVIR